MIFFDLASIKSAQKGQDPTPSHSAGMSVYLSAIFKANWVTLTTPNIRLKLAYGSQSELDLNCAQ